MQDVLVFVNGRAYKKEELLQRGKYKVLRVGNFFTNQSWYYSDLELPKEKYCYNGDLLYAWSASFGPRIWDGEKTIFHYHIWNVKFDSKLLLKKYLYYFLEYDKCHVKDSTTGSTMIHVSMENMKPRLLPIPPFAEQQRIVERIEALLPVIEKYDKAQTELDQLNIDIYQLLKKSILQEAIQGRLVAQDPSEEPAAKLLERIQAEKQKLLSAGKLKAKDIVNSVIFKGDDNKYYEKCGNTVTCIDEEIIFEIPQGWEIARLSNIAQIYTGNSISESEKKARYTGISGREYVGTKDVGFDCSVQYNNGVAIPKQYESAFKIAPAYSVLICIEGGSAGRKIAIIDRDICFGNKLCCFAPFVNISKYIFYYLQSPLFFEMFNSGKTGIIGGVSVNNVKNLLIPIPPYQEMQRIIAKLEQALASIMSR